MPEVTAYPPGTPSWVDLGSPDIAAAAAFYTGMFGWDAPEGPPETGGYRNCTYKGRPVAGIGPQMAEGPPYWTTYVAVADADAAAAKVTAAGGTTLLAPMDVMSFGRMAVFMDPVGAAFSIWQAGDHVGAGLVNEPNTLCWNELACRDPEGAKSFYGAVFGWTPQTDEATGPYVMWNLNGRVVGGMMPMDENFPAEVPPHWMPYFAVDDTDASAARAADLGGEVVMGPMDLPVGRMAVLKDPHGAVFSIIKLVQADPAP
jgi:hypothetical protein